MIRAMIIEDERMAREQLAHVLAANFPDLELVATSDSVKDSVKYLSENRQPDVIFMDIELLDGNAFDIFRRVDVKSSVIMTTAYDSYAIKAFETGSIDYLLKPISLERLKQAIGRCRENIGYRTILTIHCGKSIIPVSTDEIAFFFSEDKANYIMTFRKERYLIETKMEQLETELDPKKFFRISRGCILNRSALISTERADGGHLTVKSEPQAPFLLTVSRSRAGSFLKWIDSH